MTNDLLSQADHLLSREHFASELHDADRRATLQEIDANLQRARRLTQESPGIAHAIVVDVLRQLDTLAVARRQHWT